MINGGLTDKFLDRVEDLFDKMAKRIDELSEKVTRLQSESASMATVRTVQDEMRSHVENQNRSQSESMQRDMHNLIAAAKSDMARENAAQMKEMLRNWMDDEFIPAGKTLYANIEDARRKARRRFWTWAIGIAGGAFSLVGMTAGAVLWIIT